ncbi:hypothetical protein QOZ80_4BG0348420 [Eleusine coracana subsp. coracana]|nr:hypothetical protein QOZ80_4BG0348420 [Eleusine coracana subsp. coracana]
MLTRNAAAMAVVRVAHPTFRGAHDGVAFAAHAAFVCAGYSLFSVGPDALIDPSHSGNEEVDIDGWNSMERCYAFIYNKEEKGKTKRVQMGCLAIGDLLAIDVQDLEVQDKPLYSVQICVKEFFSEENPKNYGDMYKNFAGLIETISSNVLSKLDGSTDAVAAKKNDAESSSSMQRLG